MDLVKAFVYTPIEKNWHRLDPFFNSYALHTFSLLWWEQQLLKSAKIPFFTFDNELFTSEGKKVESLEGHLYLIRGDFSSDQIRGGVPQFSSSDETIIWQWPRHVDEQYTGRKIGIIDKKTLLNPEIQWKTIIQYQHHGHVFIKPMRKINRDRYGPFTFGDNDQFSRAFENILDRIDAFIVAQPVTFDTEEGEPKGILCGGQIEFEYRAWIADHRILNIAKKPSSKRKNVPKEYHHFAQEFVEAYSDRLPWGYVLDMTSIEGRIVVKALNPLTRSERYPKNNFIDLLNVFPGEYDKERLERELPRLQEQYDRKLRRALCKFKFSMNF